MLYSRQLKYPHIVTANHPGTSHTGWDTQPQSKHVAETPVSVDAARVSPSTPSVRQSQVINDHYRPRRRRRRRRRRVRMFYAASDAKPLESSSIQLPRCFRLSTPALSRDI